MAQAHPSSQAHGTDSLMLINAQEAHES